MGKHKDQDIAGNKVPGNARVNSMYMVLRPFWYITGHIFQSMILSHFSYITRERDTASKVIEEENHYLKEEDEIDLENFKVGWIKKTLKEIQYELMLNGLRSTRTISDDISGLEEKGLLLVRKTQAHAYDQTREYRININGVEKRFNELGGEQGCFSVQGSDKLPFTLDEKGNFKWIN